MLQKGFTLIELMIVVAIIGILSMFALPAYQDYTKRTYVSEGMALATGAKLAATEYFSTMGYWPADNTAAGLAAPASITGQAVHSIAVSVDGTNSEVGSGRIVITYNEKIAPSNAATLTLKSTGNPGGSTEWKCSNTTSDQTGGMQVKWLPNNCRGQAS